VDFFQEKAWQKAIRSLNLRSLRLVGHNPFERCSPQTALYHLPPSLEVIRGYLCFSENFPVKGRHPNVTEVEYYLVGQDSDVDDHTGWVSTAFPKLLTPTFHIKSGDDEPAALAWVTHRIQSLWPAGRVIVH
jgi:hypothetical protein